MEETVTQIWQILTTVLGNLLDPEAWKAILSRSDIIVAAFITLSIIVFTETGLLIGFFLPGDSLLVTAGIVGASVGWPMHLLIPLLCVMSISGDSLGYLIGRKAGPRLFSREQSFFFRKNHLLQAQAFYELHGGKAIIIAHFIPFLRTFAPVVAGIAQMKFKRFLGYIVIGAIGWISSMLMLGYTLHLWLDPLFKPIFGEGFKIEKHIDKVVIVIVLLSVLPILLKGLKSYVARAKPEIKSPASKVNPRA